MARYSYERLTALDNSFLVLEQPNAYMHVASTMVLDAGPFQTADGGIDADRLKRLIGARLHLIPRYRQKLAWIPFNNHPVWIDDDRFNLDYHVRHTSLPRPGTEEQLKRLSSRVMQQHLDRRRPLWEMWIAEGLEGNRFAIISKVHHCMIDGVSGVDIMKVLMSLTPEYEEHDAPAYVPRPAPSGLELWRHEMMRWASLPLRTLTGISTLVREATDARRNVITTARAAAHMVGTSLRRPSPTPLNAEIGPHRRFEWMTTDLSEIKLVRKALGGSLNDIVLTIVTGAVRELLKSRQLHPETIDFRILAPVSVRTEKEQGALGNRVSAWLVELPLAQKDPLRQLELIRARTTELKESKEAVAAEVLTQVAEWTPSTLLSLAGRNVSRLLPFNMVVTNVPGPQVPMYMFGARMTECYPHVPLTDYLGLGIALMSCEGKLCWGFNGDYDLMPDLPAFAASVREIGKDLVRLAAIAAAKNVQVAAAAAAASAPTPAPQAPQPSHAGAPLQTGNGDVHASASAASKSAPKSTH